MSVGMQPGLAVTVLAWLLSPTFPYGSQQEHAGRPSTPTSFRNSVDMVTLNEAVKDRKGCPVTTVARESFARIDSRLRWL